MAPGIKTGGRRKGTPNKATTAKHAAIVASGDTPLDFMLRLMRDTSIDWSMRADMAKASAPYIHPKLASTEITGNADKPVQHKVTIEFVRAGE